MKHLFSLLSFFIFFFGMIFLFLSVNELGLGLLLSLVGVILGLIFMAKTS